MIMRTLIVLLAVVACAVNGGVLKRQISFPTGRVVGGHEAQQHEAPFIVSLQIFGQHFCGGSLIRPDLVLTAAHCLAYPASFVTVVAGLHDINGASSSQSAGAKKFTKHSKYGGSVGPYDIGLIQLSKSLSLTSEVGVIGLPDEEVIHSGEVTLFGWGSTSTSNSPIMPKLLQTVNKPIVDYDECEKALGGPGASPLHPTNVCTGPLTGGISACSGDSGGPLVQKNNAGDYELVGVVSWGYIPCGSVNAPSVYTRVSAHNEWIAQNSLMFL